MVVCRLCILLTATFCFLMSSQGGLMITVSSLDMGNAPLRPNNNPQTAALSSATIHNSMERTAAAGSMLRPWQAEQEEEQLGSRPNRNAQDTSPYARRFRCKNKPGMDFFGLEPLCNPVPVYGNGTGGSHTASSSRFNGMITYHRQREQQDRGTAAPVFQNEQNNEQQQIQQLLSKAKESIHEAVDCGLPIWQVVKAYVSLKRRLELKFACSPSHDASQTTASSTRSVHQGASNSIASSTRSVHQVASNKHHQEAQEVKVVDTRKDEVNDTNFQQQAVYDEKVLQLKWELLQKVDQKIVATQRAYDRVALIIQRADHDLSRKESLAQVRGIAPLDGTRLYDVHCLFISSTCLLYNDVLVSLMIH